MGRRFGSSIPNCTADVGIGRGSLPFLGGLLFAFRENLPLALRKRIFITVCNK
jgi:hypothetical protein